MTRGLRTALFVCGLLSLAEAGVAAGATPPSDPHALLDVPYVAQTAELCGGAAVAMVLRYWGGRDVFPQDFAPLVTASDGGILTTTLASAVRERGWQALVLAVPEDTTHAEIRSAIDRGQPLIALIEVGSHAYHYVVIVGSTDRVVVLHDPARAPFRVLSWDEFDRAWAATGRWTMLVLPEAAAGAGNGDAMDADTRRPPPSAQVNRATDVEETPCGALVNQGVETALAGDRPGAEQALEASTRLCPNEPGAWRELAGLRFSESRWSDAQALALVAVRLAPDDAYSWQLVATSRYLGGDLAGALRAWNHTGEPRIDAIDIRGAGRTPQPAIVRAMGLQPRAILTPDAFLRASRRLGDVPAASSTRMRYDPLDGGLARVDAFVAERHVVPAGWFALANLGARALVQNELHVDVANALGAGELARVEWRWSAERPRVSFGLALPSPQWVPGIISVESSWEAQSYQAAASPDGGAVAREARRRVGVRLGDWSTGWLRWETGAALDRLREYDDVDASRFDPRDYLAVDGTVDARLFRDRFAVEASAGWWTPAAGGDAFGTGGVRAAWRSTTDVALASWSVTSGAAFASREAPLALWQGAGTGQGRDALLRAHPLLSEDVLTGPVFGRDLLNSSIEYARPVTHAFAGALSIAAFVDTARAWQRVGDRQPSPFYVDAGAGVRLRAPGADGTIRIDVARGLRGGGRTLSASWSEAWPW